MDVAVVGFEPEYEGAPGEAVEALQIVVPLQNGYYDMLLSFDVLITVVME